MVDDELVDATRIEIRAACSSTRMACCIFLVLANFGPPVIEVSVVSHPKMSHLTPRSENLASHAIPTTTRQTSCRTEWKDGGSGITGETEPTAPYDLSLRSSLQYRHVTKPLAASHQERSHARAEDLEVPSHAFQFFKEPGISPTFWHHSTYNLTVCQSNFSYCPYQKILSVRTLQHLQANKRRIC